MGLQRPDFVKVAQAYGIEATALMHADEMDSAMGWLWDRPHEPSLLHVSIDTYANAYPKIAFGRPITEMEPLAKPMEMEGT